MKTMICQLWIWSRWKSFIQMCLNQRMKSRRILTWKNFSMLWNQSSEAWMSWKLITIHWFLMRKSMRISFPEGKSFQWKLSWTWITIQLQIWKIPSLEEKLQRRITQIKNLLWLEEEWQVLSTWEIMKSQIWQHPLGAATQALKNMLTILTQPSGTNHAGSLCDSRFSR